MTITVALKPTIPRQSGVVWQSWLGDFAELGMSMTRELRTLYILLFGTFPTSIAGSPSLLSVSSTVGFFPAQHLGQLSETRLRHLCLSFIFRRPISLALTALRHVTIAAYTDISYFTPTTARHCTFSFREHGQQHSRDWDRNPAFGKALHAAWMGIFLAAWRVFGSSGRDAVCFFFGGVKRVDRFCWGVFGAWGDFVIRGY